MSFGTDLNNNVKDSIAPKVVDTVLGGNKITQIFLGWETGKFTGKNKQYVVKVTTAGNGGSFAGLDRFNTNKVDTTQKLTFEPRFYEQPIIFSGDELSVSKTDEAVIDLQIQKGEEAAQEMADGIGTALYWDGTGNNNKDFLGLIAGCDDGSNVATYGGLSRATYTTIKGNYDGSTTTITLDAIDSLMRSCNSGNDKVNVILTTEAIYHFVEKLMQPVTQNVNIPYDTTGMFKSPKQGLVAQAGYTSLFYKGVPIYADEKCPANHMFLLNTRTWEFATLDLYDMDPVMLKSTVIEGQYDINTEKSYGFFISKMLRPLDQYGLVSHLMLGGNLMCKNPKRNGYFDAITA